jgi:regulator of protease activity HflC (stomatin/prohibitin superfamily)
MAVGVILILAGIAAFIYSRTPNTPKGISQLGIAGLILGVIVTIAAGAFVSVPVGSLGVVNNRVTGLRPGSLEPGLHFVLPGIETVVLYSSRLQERTLSRRGEGGPNVDESINVLSKEGLQIGLDVTVQFQVRTGQVNDLHSDIGPDYENVVIVPQIRSEVRDAVGQFNAAELISTKRGELKTAIKLSLEKNLTTRHLDLVDVLLREIRIPDQITKAITDKQEAEQNVQTARKRLEQATIEAQQTVVKAQAEAKALSARGQALRQNPEIIQLTVAEKLAPGIQTIMLPSQGNFLLDIGTLTRRNTTPATPAKP